MPSTKCRRCLWHQRHRFCTCALRLPDAHDPEVDHGTGDHVDDSREQGLGCGRGLRDDRRVAVRVMGPPLRLIPQEQLTHILSTAESGENPLISGIFLPIIERIVDRLEGMSILVAVVDAGSLSAASRQLGIPLATVSRKVGELEAHLKTRLLNRSTRQLSLTEAGESYVASCRRILEEIGEVERAATGEYAAPKGYLVATAPLVFGQQHVVPVMASFLAHYPDIDARLLLTDRNVHFLEEHVDVAVRIGQLPDSTLVAIRIGETRPIVCASPAYLAAHGTPGTPAELANHACISFDGLTSSRAWTFCAGKSEQTVQIHSRLVTNTAESAIDAAAHGTGLTRVLSYQVADALREGRLQLVLEKFKLAPLPIHLVHAGQTPLPLKLRAFLDFMSPRLKARISTA
jgi:DNA-binding transcriptional LysR family regulator